MKKRNSLKRIIAMILVISIVIMPETALAANIKEVTEIGTENCSVTAVIEPSYTASIPTSLSLSKNGSEYSFIATYKIGVKGNIASNQTLSITPASSFQMVDVNNSTIQATAHISQNYTRWKYNQSTSNTLKMLQNETAEATGTITVTFTQAGTYKGNFGFLVELVTE